MIQVGKRVMMVTNYGVQNDGKSYITGVAFHDQDGDGMLSHDEGISGVNIIATDSTGKTFTST